MRPPLNEKVFPVYRPVGLKGPTGTFFFIFSKKKKLGGGGGNPNLPTGSFIPHPAHRKRFFLLKDGLKEILPMPECEDRILTKEHVCCVKDLKWGINTSLFSKYTLCFYDVSSDS